jgi:hypothetical protein
MNAPTETRKNPINCLEISYALVRLIERQQGVYLGIDDIGATVSLSANGQFLYMIITLRNDIDDAVVKALTTVSRHITAPVGAWVLSEREVRRLLRNAKAGVDI